MRSRIDERLRRCADFNDDDHDRDGDDAFEAPLQPPTVEEPEVVEAETRTPAGSLAFMNQLYVWSTLKMMQQQQQQQQSAAGESTIIVHVVDTHLVPLAAGRARRTSSIGGVQKESRRRRRDIDALISLCPRDGQPTDGRERARARLRRTSRLG